MRNFIFTGLAALFSFSVFAADITTFSCEMTKYPKQKFSFKMKNLGKPSMGFLNSNPRDGYSDVFTTTSKNETVLRTVGTLNGQGGDLRVLADRIQFFGDSAGVDFVYLELFKNSGFKAGFARLDFNFSEDKKFSPVFCLQSK
ncbi:MAG TPA: hypothetical protein VNJ01_08880 [Bacteriovoracaceae bacterium]|nr:hypothetical protein [Bacteriovoracaceae bacterium]